MVKNSAADPLETLDNVHAGVYLMGMDKNTGTENWTPAQHAMYEALKASFAKSEAERLNRPSIMNHAPKGGWTDADRIAK